MANRTHTGWLLLVFSRNYASAVAASLLAVSGVAAGCGEAMPTAPSARVVTNPAPTNPGPTNPGPTNHGPTIVSVTPSLGSTGGGASIRITGLGLAQGVRVAFGSTSVPAFFASGVDDSVFVRTPSHAAGSVDVTVTNPDGHTARAMQAYTFAPPESFDVNGNWEGPAFSGDYDEPFTFTVVNGAVVSISCWTSGVVTLSPPAPIIHGEFSFRDEDGVAISGTILAPNEAHGSVNVGPCANRGWHATRE
jgi:hypothetical protein